MGAFAITGGLVLVAYSIFFVGRRIARVLWGILIVLEKDDAERQTLKKQRDALFEERDHVNNPTLLDKFSNAQFRRMRDVPPWQV